MNKSLIIGGVVVLAFIVSAGWCLGRCGPQVPNNAKTLTIKWQRLVGQSGGTCERCELTQTEVQKAFHILKQSFGPLGIQVALQEKSLDPATFTQDVSQSNRIWLGGRPLEEWLHAEVGKSVCGSCPVQVCCSNDAQCATATATCPAKVGCGDNVECRTIELAGQTYETIPADLIIRAALLAAFDLLSDAPNGPSPQDISSTSCGGCGSQPAATLQGCN